MSKINVNTWEPESGTAATLMATGDTVTVPSGAEIDIASGATLDVNGTIDITGATQTGFPSAGFSKYTVVVASDATFDLDSDTTKLIIEIQASGSTAGSTDGATYGGGGGGAGAYAKKLLTGLTGATDKLNITIGSVAGAGVSGTTTSVAQAGTASFATITCTGGTGGTSSPGGSHGAGGAGGAVPTTGDLNIAGASGTGGQSYDAGYGPDSILGFGGGWPAVSNVGNGGAAIGYGAGGGGGRGASKSGGAGSAAVVIVWEYK